MTGEDIAAYRGTLDLDRERRWHDQGYVLPRLQVLTDRSWLAVLLVGFGLPCNITFLPFAPDGRQLLFRFLIFLPLVVVMPILYLRVRRLLPFVVAHWGMDFVLTLMTLA
jgi:hypothetical protein